LSARPGAIPALAAARRAVRPRRAVWLDGERVGCVAEPHLPLLAAEVGAFEVGAQRVDIVLPPTERQAQLARLHHGWHAQGAIVGWRDEPYALAPLDGPAAGTPRVAIERAASRFWGSLTFGAHANGFVRGPDGRAAALWIAQRSSSKPTDPGLFDNLVGGGVPLGQRPAETLVREAWEEAGLAADLATRATPVRVLRIERDIPEGLQREWLYAFDLELPAGLTPQNQDGEVQGFRLLALQDALALALGEAMTVDAALVTLDFAFRHGVLPAALAESWRSFLASPC
jgi:8-oxo-dGTP pyrophosphatase MutT (NUDIX family)